MLLWSPSEYKREARRPRKRMRIILLAQIHTNQRVETQSILQNLGRGAAIRTVGKSDSCKSNRERDRPNQVSMISIIIKISITRITNNIISIRDFTIIRINIRINFHPFFFKNLGNIHPLFFGYKSI